MQGTAIKFALEMFVIIYFQAFKVLFNFQNIEYYT